MLRVKVTSISSDNPSELFFSKNESYIVMTLSHRVQFNSCQFLPSEPAYFLLPRGEVPPLKVEVLEKSGGGFQSIQQVEIGNLGLEAVSHSIMIPGAGLLTLELQNVGDIRPNGRSPSSGSASPLNQMSAQIAVEVIEGLNVGNTNSRIRVKLSIEGRNNSSTLAVGPNPKWNEKYFLLTQAPPKGPLLVEVFSEDTQQQGELLLYTSQIDLMPYLHGVGPEHEEIKLQENSRIILKIQAMVLEGGPASLTSLPPTLNTSPTHINTYQPSLNASGGIVPFLDGSPSWKYQRPSILTPVPIHNHHEGPIEEEEMYYSRIVYR
eukprot:NODE_4481_length_1161_cov_45.260116_g3963_i0.p1 GENE.NODE_4481_length_1161_cov_45.260116_g3963_i0~~NODE_4481_length_1161_cov_45.260116_g3963_i0.p1  ORF type:complete len:351 (-),score=65.27 NODE_4481_length_1161_cov_45.260116_g3963_i0:107-1069(-)